MKLNNNITLNLSNEELETIHKALDTLEKKFEVLKADSGLNGEDFRNDCFTLMVKLKTKK